MPKHSPRVFYDKLIADMPIGAERVVLRVLSFHIGQISAIQKADLQNECSSMGAHFSDERQLRLTIVKLRKTGIPICASSGESGYFLASTLDEYREFRGREYVKKIVDMRETVDAMDASIKVLFSDDYQKYQMEKSERAGQPALI